MTFLCSSMMRGHLCKPLTEKMDVMLIERVSSEKVVLMQTKERILTM